MLFLHVSDCLYSSVITLGLGLIPQLHCRAVKHKSVKLESLDRSLEQVAEVRYCHWWLLCVTHSVWIKYPIGEL